MIVGIDLGTTNSLVGIWRDGASVLIPNALGGMLTPSVVGTDEMGEVLVGKAARDRLVTSPELTAATFKRYMGTNRDIFLGRVRYRPEELSALLLRSLKADAENFLGETVTEAIITVPAYFNDSQRKATKAAGQLAGLKVDRLLTEPTAAALAYGFKGDEDSTILVIDLGGGTLDVSLLHAFEGIMEVKSTAGDIWLGGEDFTEALVTTFLAEAGKELGELSQNLPLQAAVRRQAEFAKRNLSDALEARMEVVHNDKAFSWTITRDRFEQISEPLMARVRLPLERALRDARLTPDQISRVIFAGGATRMPMFRRLISRLFKQLPTQHISPDEVVARGAAVRVGLAQRSEGLEENLLTDVSPFTLGVEVSSNTQSGTRLNGLFLPIIERNTVVPTSRSHVLSTVAHNQRQVRLPIYQGEARMVSDNVYLGEINVAVPEAPAGQERVEVRFSYDNSGLLDVDVLVLSTKLRENLLIEGNLGTLSQEEIRNRLAKLDKLKVHPRDQAENVALLARALRIFEENLGDLRLRVGQVIDQFSAILETQDIERIAAARGEATKFLDAVDKSPFV